MKCFEAFELFPSHSWCCAFSHRVAFEEGSGPRVLLKSGPGNRGRSACGPTHVARLEFPREKEAGNVVWYSHLFKNFPHFVVIHTVKGFGVVNKAEVDVSLEFTCFFYDPTDVGHLISGSSAFSKSILKIWKFSVYILLKPRLENFEHCFASVWDECSCAVV